MIWKIAIDFGKQRIMLARKQLHQPFYHRPGGTIARIPTDAERFVRRSFGNARDIAVDDIERGSTTRPLGPIARCRHRTELLDVRAEERTSLEDHLEAIIIGGVVAAGYLDAAINILQNGFGII